MGGLRLTPTARWFRSIGQINRPDCPDDECHRLKFCLRPRNECQSPLTELEARMIYDNIEDHPGKPEPE